MPIFGGQNAEKMPKMPFQKLKLDLNRSTDGPHSTHGVACCYATMELLAKLEEEEGGQDLTREQLRGVILVLGVLLIDAMVVGRGGSVYRH